VDGALDEILRVRKQTTENPVSAGSSSAQHLA
jgi:hypothetical protein